MIILIYRLSNITSVKQYSSKTLKVEIKHSVKMQLYGSIISPPSRAVMLTAEAIGLNLEMKELDLMAGAHKTPEFLKLNPQGQVPLLIDDGLAISESRAIMQYLVEKYAKDDSLYPKDLNSRTVVNSRLYFDCGTLWPILHETYGPLFRNLDVQEGNINRTRDAMKVVEEFLSQNKWIAGPTLTIADISYLPIISNATSVFGFNLAPYPNILKWLDECKKNIPGYKINEEGVATLRWKLNKILKKF